MSSNDRQRRRKLWTCRIGEIDEDQLPEGADYPMRLAIAQAYRLVIGRDADFIFSGWADGRELTKHERDLVEAHAREIPPPPPAQPETAFKKG